MAEFADKIDKLLAEGLTSTPPVVHIGAWDQLSDAINDEVHNHIGWEDTDHGVITRHSHAYLDGFRIWIDVTDMVGNTIGHGLEDNDAFVDFSDPPSASGTTVGDMDEVKYRVRWWATSASASFVNAEGRTILTYVVRQEY